MFQLHNKKFHQLNSQLYFLILIPCNVQQLVFLSFLKQKQERKKQEEEILQKENLANLQIQEEANIIAKLKVKAKRNWPDDYTTQEFWINQQIEAYHNMLTIPDTDRIKKKAQRDWPLDFTTQQFWYNEQIDAKQRLE